MWISFSASAAKAAPGTAMIAAATAAIAKRNILPINTPPWLRLKAHCNSIRYTSRSTRKSVHAKGSDENSFTQTSTNAAWGRCLSTMSRDSAGAVRYGLVMDSVVIEQAPGADAGFDSDRVAAAVDALAEKHAGREDVF